MTHVYTVIDSPIESLTLVANDGLLCGLYMDTHRHRLDIAAFGDRDAKPFAPVIQELEEYFAGERTTFDAELAPAGNAFQHTVWNALRTIPYGTTASYGEIATLIGKPGAARAVGTANGQNPVSIIVPCHRVIGANGQLVGYGGGLERKEYLLDLEKARATPQLFV